MAPGLPRLALAFLCAAWAAGTSGTAAAEAVNDGEGDCPAGAGAGACRQGSGAAGAGEYYWAKRAGNLLSNSYTPHTALRNLSVAPTWRWENPDDELVRHTPLIDHELNIYLVTAPGWVRKFSPDGQVLWSWRTTPAEGKMVTSGHLDGGNIFLSSVESYIVNQAYAYSMDMQTGKLNWKAQLPSSARMNMDSSTVFVANGTYLVAMTDRLQPLPHEGNNKIIALNASTGDFLWDYMIGAAVWNFMPATPGDGTVLFATHCGRAHRLNLATGAPVWVAALQEPSIHCGTGGGALAPDGEVFHVIANHYGVAGEVMPGVPHCVSEQDCVQGPGMHIAYRVRDGKILMAKRFFNWGNQYPAVGPAAGVGTAVAIGIGQNPNLVFHFFERFIPSWFPDTLKGALFQAQFHLSWVRWWLGFKFDNNFLLVGDGEKLDQQERRPLWHYQEEPWDHFTAAGDELEFLGRSAKNQQDPSRGEAVCGPDSWGIPVISGDGTVYGTSGITGNMYAIRDDNGDGVVQGSEISTLRTGVAFLNGPALAPGLLVAAPCWGPMYVFRS